MSSIQSDTSRSTSSSSSQKPAAAATAAHSAEEDEFLIAADLTLYANPLRCLQSKKSTKAGGKKTTGEGNNSETSKEKEERMSHHNTKGISDQSKRYDNDANTMIAADLVKYGSPLDG